MSGQPAPVSLPSPTPIRDGFDPARHLSRVNGSPYLEVKWQLAWFRDRYPDGRIETELLDRGPDWVIFRATVTAVSEGGVLCGRATGHSHGDAESFRDYLEKTETGAIGRALTALGFGTQFATHPEGVPPHGTPEETPRPADAATTTATAARPGQPGSPDGMTARQQSYLEAVARAAGLDAEQLDALALQRFGGEYRRLSRTNASALIRELQQR